MFVSSLIYGVYFKNDQFTLIANKCFFLYIYSIFFSYTIIRCSYSFRNMESNIFGTYYIMSIIKLLVVLFAIIYSNGLFKSSFMEIG